MTDDIKKQLRDMLKVNLKIFKELAAASQEIEDTCKGYSCFLKISDGEICIAKKGPDGYLVEVLLTSKEDE